MVKILVDHNIKDTDKKIMSSLYHRNIKNFDVFIRKELTNYDNFIEENVVGSDDHVWMVLGFALNNLKKQWIEKYLQNDKKTKLLSDKILLLNEYESLIDDIHFDIKYFYPAIDKEYQKNILNFQNYIYENKDNFNKKEWGFLVKLKEIFDLKKFRDFIYYNHSDIISEMKNYWTEYHVTYNLVLLNRKAPKKYQLNNFTVVEIEDFLKNQVNPTKNDWKVEDYKYWRSVNKIISLLQNILIVNYRFESEKNPDSEEIFQLREKYINNNEILDLDIPDMNIVVANNTIPLKLLVYILFKNYLSEYINKNSVYLEKCPKYNGYLSHRLNSIEDYLKINLKKFKLKDDPIHIDYYFWVLSKAITVLNAEIRRMEMYYRFRIRKSTKNFRSPRYDKIDKTKNAFKKTKDVIKVWIRKRDDHSQYDEDFSSEDVFNQIINLKKVNSEKNVIALLKKWGIPINYWDNFNESYKIKSNINMSEKKAKVVKF